jgi:plasmid stabilization system protein ParE
VRGVRFHPETEAEFIAAGEFYEPQAAGLGFDFVAEVRQVRHAARTIAAHPEVGHRFSKRLRPTLVRRFPYGLLYLVDADTIFGVP